MTNLRLSIVAAHAHDRVIGTAQGIPWHLPADQAHWRGLVAGHAIIVGDNTYKEQGTLEDSYNVVISRDTSLSIPKGTVATSVDEAIKLAGEHEPEEIFVVGGASIFEQTITLADRLYLTIIDLDIPLATKYFPEYLSDFSITANDPANDQGINFRFTVWERN